MTSSTERFVALDGLRGIAALGVVMLHNRAAFGGDHVFGHAYLAVDLFFILSGFVLARAYRDRLNDWRAVGAFAVQRAIRLIPLLVLGALLGALTLPWRGDPGSQALAVLATAVGAPAWWRADPFLVNPPTWSLFWEIVACAAFALLALRRTRLPALPVVGTLGVVMVGIALTQQNLDVGLAVTPGGFLLGAPRVALAFLIGTLLSRQGIADRAFAHAFRPWLGPVLLVSLTLLPNRTPLAAIYDPIVAYILFPLLILAGARTICRFPRAAALAGALSYPLYILHHPLIQLMERAAVAMTGAPTDRPVHIVITFLTIPLSYLALRCYDEPLRRRLRALARNRPERGDAAMATTTG